MSEENDLELAAMLKVRKLLLKSMMVQMVKNWFPLILLLQIL